MKQINSRSNAYVRHILELHTSQGRTTHRKFIAQGIRVCKTLIEYGVKLEAILCSLRMKDAALTIASPSQIILAHEHVMDKISPVTQSSGILGVFYMPPSPEVSSLSSGIVLARIQDPGNMGTLIRSAVSMNAPSVVIVEGCDPWNPKVIHASAGTIAKAYIYEWTWQELLSNKNKSSLCALVVSGGDSIQEIPNTNTLLVVGNEAQGIPDQWIDQCNTKATLAMPGNTESLNAAVAGSIALYQLFVAHI